MCEPGWFPAGTPGASGVSGSVTDAYDVLVQSLRMDKERPVSHAMPCHHAMFFLFFCARTPVRALQMQSFSPRALESTHGTLG